MLTRASAFVATLTGKIVLATGLALAAAGGAQAAGIINVNRLRRTRWRWRGPCRSWRR